MVSTTGRPKKEEYSDVEKIMDFGQFSLWRTSGRYLAFHKQAPVAFARHKYLGGVIREIIARFNPSATEILRLQAIWEEYKGKKR